MDLRKYPNGPNMSSFNSKTSNTSNKFLENHIFDGRERVSGRSIVTDKVPEIPHFEGRERVPSGTIGNDIDIDLREVYFLIMHFLSSGPCQKTCVQFLNELMEHKLMPRRYHAWYSRTNVCSGDEDDDGVSLPLTYENIMHRYPHIAKDHLVRLLKQLMLSSPSPSIGMGYTPSAVDVPTLLGTGSFSLLSCDSNVEKKQVKYLPRYLRWPHIQVDQVHGLHLRAIGGGFTRHHRAPSIHAACYAIAKPSTMVQKMQNIKRLRGHRNAVYCAIFDRAGRYVITGSDDRLVKIWSMETAFCLASCRGHEGDITDLAVSSNNALVASASNDFVIRVWRLPDGLPISILQGHTGAVTAIAFSPRTAYQLLSSSDDGTCRIWDARNSQLKPRIYIPKPPETRPGIIQQNNHQILCCSYNANGTVFVTGSSDTHARVWNAPKFCSDEPEQPFNEIDLLAGHENDVNYVQFSGSAIMARSVSFDALKDDQSLRFKNMWFSHDNIVTCSRDGSAIIWVPRSRKSHGKVGRWTKAYHLKVPPPPLPPQPPRGGPRRRILPTPRGVNMIVWSLDNRFVLAAIMDCRICVWNAADGSLVHCLTGHTESTYVLDVHPFNPRLALSAGYDGKTIIWDIWEGTPVRIFEIGRGKLVDGKFSSDGTSIVLSDDIGQIYLLNTGQGESHKDAKYDQFFLGDYRPLIRDTMGNVVDQESQLNPYQRNLLDPLCDSSMIPYPEPYQSMYQRRRLGALGVEFRPSSIKFAIGPDFSLGEDYQIVPLPDPEAIIDIPELLDATLWEPENEVIMSDDADSEYDVGEEYSSVKEQESLDTSSSGDMDSDAENFDFKQKQKDGLRRSKRKNERTDVEFTASGRRIRRKRVEDCTGTSSQTIKGKKVKSSRKSSKKKPSKTKQFRPQRAATRNASSAFSKFSDSEEEIEEEVEEDEEEGSGFDSSESDPFSHVSDIQDGEPSWDPPITLNQEREKPPFDEFPSSMNPIEPSESQVPSVNRKKLVLKLCVRDSSKTLPKNDGKKVMESSSSLPQTEENNGPHILNDEDMDLHPPTSTDHTPSQSGNKFKIRCKGQLEMVPNYSGNFERSEGGDIGVSSKMSQDSKENSHPIPTKIKIKSSGISKQEKTPKLKLVTGKKKLVDFEDDDFSNGYDESFDYPDFETNVVRRTRSMEMKASTCEGGRENCKLKSWKNDRSAGTSKISESSSRDYMLNSNLRSRSSRSKQENFYEDEVGPASTSRSNVGRGRIPWLLLSEHEPGYRYIPQLGDEVVYLMQGHQEYIETCAPSDRGPWTLMKERINDVELCSVESLNYVTLAGSGDSACKLTLKFIDNSSSVFGKSFKLTLPELLQAPDFLVEKSWYDFSVSRNLDIGDICSVWWRHEVEEGGSWWEGRIISIKPKSSDFPNSPWERYAVLYQSDPNPQLHSPWELHEHDVRWDPTHLDFETRNKLLDYLSKLERRRMDSGLVNLEQASQKPDFLNRFPVPLSPSVIQSRLTNNYYRSVKAVQHDINVMMSNAMSYFPRNGELYRKMKRMSEHFGRIFSNL